MEGNGSTGRGGESAGEKGEKQICREEGEGKSRRRKRKEMEGRESRGEAEEKGKYGRERRRKAMAVNSPSRPGALM